MSLLGSKSPPQSYWKCQW